MKISKIDIDAIAQKSQTMPRSRLWLWAGIVLILGGLAVWWWLQSVGVSGAQYTIAPVTRTDLVVTVTATGTVDPTNKVEISSELSGTIRSVEVDFNDSVTVGQILARLDTDKLEATVEHGRVQHLPRRRRVRRRLRRRWTRPVPNLTAHASLSVVA